MSVRVETKTDEIRSALRELGRRMKQGDDSQLLHWVIPDQLACGQRPLRHHLLYGGSGRNIVPEAAPFVEEWVEDVLTLGVQSIISLMHTRDLNYYENLDLGATNLIEYFRVKGLRVIHLPWEDPHHSKSTPDQINKKLVLIRQEALRAYVNLPKPVLVQCSAGIDRTAPVAAHIYVSVTGNKV